MAVPGTVTKRAQGNTFIGSTGLYVKGQTGFSISTGFYLTNSGNYPIETSLSRSDIYTEVFEFPSGIDVPLTILPGEHKFIPFNTRFVLDNLGSGPDPTLTGPDGDGLFVSNLTLASISQYDGSADPDGAISISITGQVTGADSWTSEFPAKPSGFLVKTELTTEGKPRSILRWNHPETGYYLTRYRIEYAGNIDDSSVATGIWTGIQSLTPPARQSAPYYNTIYQDKLIAGHGFLSPITCRFFGEVAGISQLYSREVTGNPPSNYGEFTAEGLGFGADYYYRLRSEYVHPSIPSLNYYGEYIYGYPVDNFNELITNNEVLTGLASGCPSTLPPGGSASNIKNTTSDPQALKIYFTDGQGDINLKDLFDAELTKRNITNTAFDSTSADYAFSGVNFILPEHFTVGATSSSNAGIETGDKIEDASSNEINVVLTLENDSKVAGCGGTGGDGGYTRVKMSETNRNLMRWVNTFNISGKEWEKVPSVDGRVGSAAIKITDSGISLFRIRRDFTSSIYGGGGGGGGGDPFFWPKAFTLDSNPVFLFEKYSATWGGNLSIKVNKDWAKGDLGEFKFDITFDTDLDDSTFNNVTFPFKVSDILGDHIAGVGGGGQGFGYSPGGASLIQGPEAQFEAQKGSIGYPGAGSNARDKRSPGGSGGLFGEDGRGGLNANATMLFTLDAKDALPADGGKAGAAIESVATTYTVANFQGKLLLGSETSTASPDQINSLVAWFSTDDTSKLIKTLPSTPINQSTDNSVRIQKWISKNDATIYMDAYEPGHYNTNYRPLFLNKILTVNEKYNKYLGGQNVAYLDGKTFRGLEINNIVGSGKLEEGMDGFEIMYFLAPIVDFDWGHAPFYPETFPDRPDLASQWAGETRNAKNTPKYGGWALHQWSDIGPEDVDKNISYNHTTQFYDNQGFIREGTGLRRKSFRFRDFTNQVNPKRGWCYSISAKKRGSAIDYAVFNDTRRIFQTNVDGGAFSWIDKPIIGACKKYSAHVAHQTRWFGCIAHLAVFNKALTYDERRALVNYFAETGARILASTDKTDESKRNTLAMENGFAGFNIFAS